MERREVTKRQKRKYIKKRARNINVQNQDKAKENKWILGCYLKFDILCTTLIRGLDELPRYEVFISEL